MRPSWNPTSSFQFATSWSKEPKLRGSLAVKAVELGGVLRRREQEPNQGKDEEHREESGDQERCHATEPAARREVRPHDRMF